MAEIQTTTISILHDERVDCFSLMAVVSVRTYLRLAEYAYEQRGGIAGQRDKLRTTSAIRIRRRMVDDIIQGAVIPPITIGVVTDEDEFRGIDNLSKRDIANWLTSLDRDRISIIDGMQRTTALTEAVDRNPNVLEHQIRLELWIAAKTNSLLYRMLVLNTGQVPWTLRRQVEVVFKSLLTEISDQVAFLEVLSSDEPRRRVRSGQFQADDLVEMFLAFGSRKEKVNVRERIADEFTRLDFIEAASEDQFSYLFADSLGILVRFDHALSRLRDLDGRKVRFRNGRDLFSSQPACIGFVTALAIAVQGRPGIHRDSDSQRKRMKRLQLEARRMCEHLDSLESEELETFADFDSLNELIGTAPAGVSVGDFEREFFLKAFQVLIDEQFEVNSLSPCWRAY